MCVVDETPYSTEFKPREEQKKPSYLLARLGMAHIIMFAASCRGHFISGRTERQEFMSLEQKALPPKASKGTEKKKKRMCG